MRKPVAEGSLRNPYTFIHHSLRTDLFVESGFDLFSLSDAKMVGRAHPNGVVFVVYVVLVVVYPNRNLPGRACPNVVVFALFFYYLQM